MNPNEVIGKWAVEKGLLDCWHEYKSELDTPICTTCGVQTFIANPDYTIYENIAPVLDKVISEYSIEFQMSGLGVSVFEIAERGLLRSVDCNYTALPTTLRDMVAELIDKGEV